MKRPIKILFLPSSIASMQAITARALNSFTDEVEARCISTISSIFHGIGQETIYLPQPGFSKRKLISSIYRKYYHLYQWKKWIKWADVLHYIYCPAFENKFDLKFAKRLKKPIFIEWVGSDIRDPNYLSLINPYYSFAFNNGWEYRDLEASDHKVEVQKTFAFYNAVPTVCKEMSLYLNRELFPNYITYPQRINVEDFSPNYPSAEAKRPLIVHAPTAKVFKGTDIILQAVEDLREKYDFEFRLLYDMPRSEVQKAMMKADIFIDQIIVGSYGMAACEAMANGKPVMCFIMKEVFDAGLPEHCPIVNTNPDNIREKLSMLLENAQMRFEIGRQSRHFVETYHDAKKIAGQWKELYRKAITTKSN